MAVEFKGTEAENNAKLEVLKKNLHAITGQYYTALDASNVNNEINRVLDGAKLPHGNEQQTMDSLRKLALDHFLDTDAAGNDNQARAQEIRSALCFLGYTDDSQSTNGSAWSVSRAEKGIDKFLEKNPQYRNLAVEDIYNKITDQVWNTRQQPNTPDYRELDRYSTSTFGSTQNLVHSELARNAEACFGGPEGVRAVQAMLAMRDPQRFSTDQYDRRHKKIDGVWTEQDQQALIKFREEYNKTVDKDHQIPDLVEMRWSGPIPDADPPVADRQKDMGDRIKATLAISQANWADYNARERAKDKTQLLTLPTEEDGSTNPAKIAQMQALLKINHAYNDNDMPTGQWTRRDQEALQRFVSAHKGLFTWNDMPSSVENLSGHNFNVILNYAMNKAKDDYGMTDALFTPDSVTGNSVLVATNNQVAQPPPRNAPVPPPVAPPATPPAADPSAADPPTATPPGQSSAPGSAAETPAKKPLPKAADEKPLPENTKTSKIKDNDVGQAQARLFLMGYGADAPIDGTHANLDVMLTKYAEDKGIIKKGEKLEGDNHKRAFDQMNADWAKFAQEHPATFKDVVDKGAAIRDNKDNNNNVRQMQTLLLALGGKFDRYGLDGKNWNETRGAIDAVAAPDGALGKLLAPYDVTAPWLKPAAQAATPAPAAGPGAAAPGPTGTPPGAETPAPARPKIENVWIDPVDDPFGGAGGFIKPAPAPQPTPAAAPPPPPSSQNDFAQAVGNGQQGPRQPVAAPAQPASPPTAGGLPPRGQFSTYFNGNAQATLASATAHFSRLNGDYVLDANRNLGYPLELLPYAKTGKDRGLAFLTGPDGRFAAVYAVNPDINGKVNMSYMKTYDLTDTQPDPHHKRNGLESFNHDVHEAHVREARALEDMPVSGGPSMPIRAPIVLPIPSPVYGPGVYGPPGVSVSVHGRVR